jgi:hypothetical protein
VRKMESTCMAASFAWKASSRCSKGILSHTTPRRETQTSHNLV